MHFSPFCSVYLALRFLCPFTVLMTLVRKLVVAIRFSLQTDTDFRTSDIGHWFGMTGFRILQHAQSIPSVRSFHPLLPRSKDQILNLRSKNYDLKTKN